MYIVKYETHLKLEVVSSHDKETNYNQNKNKKKNYVNKKVAKVTVDTHIVERKGEGALREREIEREREREIFIHPSFHFFF